MQSNTKVFPLIGSCLFRGRLRFVLFCFVCAPLVSVVSLCPFSFLTGYEATLYGCEGSVRQSWELSATGKISLADYYGAEYDWFVPLCLSRAMEVGSSFFVLGFVWYRGSRCARVLSVHVIYKNRSC